jgi:hypothetical protein
MRREATAATRASKKLTAAIPNRRDLAIEESLNTKRLEQALAACFNAVPFSPKYAATCAGAY